MPKMDFTDAKVRSLDPPAQGATQYFETVTGGGRALVLYVGCSGIKQWRVMYYEDSKPRSQKLGNYPDLSLKDAREKVRVFNVNTAIAVAHGESVKQLGELWCEKKVSKLRSGGEVKRHLTRYVYPVIGDENIHHVTRSMIADLLDKVEARLIIKRKRRRVRKDKDKPKPKTPPPAVSQADAVLRTLNTFFVWYTGRDDVFKNPVTRALKRDTRKVREKARQRVLTDEEIKLVWNACSQLGTYGQLVRMLLLTAQRRETVANMKWADIRNGVWTPPQIPDAKGHIGAVKLPDKALAILQDCKTDSDYVFPARHRGRTVLSKPFNSFGGAKLDLDALVQIPPWVLHDLRRTARTLMSRIGISPDHAELTLGHMVEPLRGVYDTHSYFKEKSRVLQRLSDFVDRLLTDAGGNVIPMR